MNMLDHRGNAAVVLALGVAISASLGGCTITTYSGRDPYRGSSNTAGNAAPAKTEPSQPEQPAQAGSSKRRGFKFPLRKGATPTAKPGGSATAGAPTAPKITSANVFGNGTGGRFKGLAYVIPQGTTKMPDFSTLVPFATLFTNQFNVAEQEFSGGFPGALVQEEWFAIRYEGKFALAAAGDYTIKLTSDDGAILYIDGKKILDNDGVHTAKTVTATETLSAGNHDLRLDYFQAQKGKVALQLSIAIGQKEQLAP